MKTYTVVVTERYVTRFTVEAESEEDAKKRAEERCVDGDFANSENLTCERDSHIED